MRAVQAEDLKNIENGQAGNVSLKADAHIPWPKILALTGVGSGAPPQPPGDSR
jgi:hypothetical protein